MIDNEFFWHSKNYRKLKICAIVQIYINYTFNSKQLAFHPFFKMFKKIIPCDTHYVTE